MGNSETASTLASSSSSSLQHSPFKLPTSPIIQDLKSSSKDYILDEETAVSVPALRRLKADNRPKSSTSLAKNSSLEGFGNLTSNSFVIRSEIKRAKNSKGKMMLVEKKNHLSKKFLMFSIRKADLFLSNKEINTLREDLETSENPFLSKIRYFFENSTQVYLVQDYYEQSSFKNFMQTQRSFREDEMRFYLSQILVALEDLPKNQLILNKFAWNFDSKKIFFDAKGHIAINIVSMVLKKDPENQEGVFEYLAPETIESEKSCISAVIAWKMGILLYEMGAGSTPFNSRGEVLAGKLSFPIKFSPTSVDLIAKLLIVNPSKRLGSKSLEEIKCHEFFKDARWEEIVGKSSHGPIPGDKDKTESFEIFSLKDLNEEDSKKRKGVKFEV